MEKQNWQNIADKTKKEADVWKTFLNNIIGIFTFSISIGCLGTSNPKLYACISFAFALLLVFMGRKSFPETIKKLREKKDKTEVEKLFLIGLEKDNFGFAAITRYGTYYFGLAFLGAIAAGVIG